MIVLDEPERWIFEDGLRITLLNLPENHNPAMRINSTVTISKAPYALLLRVKSLSLYHSSANRGKKEKVKDNTAFFINSNPL